MTITTATPAQLDAVCQHLNDDLKLHNVRDDNGELLQLSCEMIDAALLVGGLDLSAEPPADSQPVRTFADALTVAIRLLAGGKAATQNGESYVVDGGKAASALDAAGWDATLTWRKELQAELNAACDERQALEDRYGRVWDTQELQQDFAVHGFSAPFVVVTEKATGRAGSMEFQHMPRFYFNWQPDT